MGGLGALDEFFRKIHAGKGNLVEAANATTFLRIMPHTCAANIAVSFGIGGRINASNTACAAGTQAIGFGYEAIKFGILDRAICGGAEELSPSVAAIFDVLGAIHSGEDPSRGPRPFDPKRSGIVVGEGAGTIALESFESATERGAVIIAEIGGFFSNGDGFHMTNPTPKGLMIAMEGALKDWGDAKRPKDIDYVNAHAAGTLNGDEAETVAIERIFAQKTPTSSTKGQFGHLMGGTGAIETIASLAMMENNLILPTRNHDDIDSACGNVDYIRGEPRSVRVNAFMKNSFAFGGVNACLIVARV
jgi:3-oxoacyl-[acyl-carrier-protein] synthase II